MEAFIWKIVAISVAAEASGLRTGGADRRVFICEAAA